MEPNAKLYVVTRDDLPPSQQAVQGIHAAREFTARYPDIDTEWYQRSNHLALLALPSERDLHRLLASAEAKGFRAAAFREPDRGNELTAIALEPAAKRICRDIPLALNGRSARACACVGDA